MSCDRGGIATGLSVEGRNRARSKPAIPARLPPCTPTARKAPSNNWPSSSCKPAASCAATTSSIMSKMSWTSSSSSTAASASTASRTSAPGRPQSEPGAGSCGQPRAARTDRPAAPGCCRADGDQSRPIAAPWRWPDAFGNPMTMTGVHRTHSCVVASIAAPLAA
jgi:hypothetical protein